MLIALNALQAELDAPLSREQAITLLPMLGFPIDGAEEKDGTIVLDVDITANRGDMMSHRGVARELAAKLGMALMALPQKPLSETKPQRDIHLLAPECPLYTTALLTLGKQTGTAESAASFLASLGAGVKQMPAVDASNELLQRYGHPTHAFDADTLKGAITVRFAKQGETLVTLDGVDRKLTAKDLLIADEAGPIGLAGVMGGERTKVTEATRRVLLESAYFDPKTVRLMARRHALHTDASARFGRGADPAMAVAARDLLVDRLQAWSGATLEAAWTVGAMPPRPAAIRVDEAMVARMAGEGVPASEIADLLRRLGCEMTAQGAVPPSWRHDLTIPEDLAEEVLRLRGYDHLPEALPPVQSEPEPLSPDYLKRQRIARRLANLGFHQTVTLGFVHPELDAMPPGPISGASNPQGGRALGNPLGLEHSVLRGSLLQSLWGIAEYKNLARGARTVRLFEIAPRFISTPTGPREDMTLGIVWAGVLGGEDPFSPSRSVIWNDMVGLLKDLGLSNSQIHVHVLQDGPVGAEVSLEEFPAIAERIIPPFIPISKFPAVTRDLSLLVPMDQAYSPLAEAMRKALPKECSDLRCVDIYRGKGLEPGQQAWLIRITFQADRTLTSQEVEVWVKAATAVAEQLGARLRG